ncbi:hypothetical protein BDZ94DRAFT_966547 [Collybia nuda]|uniref:Uncharacterized protein n=1 Tax=Collybia nuda TaxID=64659 RepID=A0A9P5YF71_9AGAR|nr:hypothetical protein BDZ94DRAFT_966547 [Collybia nuda]
MSVTIHAILNLIFCTDNFKGSLQGTTMIFIIHKVKPPNVQGDSIQITRNKINKKDPRPDYQPVRMGKVRYQICMLVTAEMLRVPPNNMEAVGIMGIVTAPRRKSCDYLLATFRHITVYPFDLWGPTTTFQKHGLAGTHIHKRSLLVALNHNLLRGLDSGFRVSSIRE